MQNKFYPTMTPQSTLGIRILDKLGIGHANAITLKDLCKRLDTKREREVRLAIEQLRHEGFLILISNHAPWGYFMAQTKDEVADFIAYFRSRIIDEALILRSIKKAGKSKFEKIFQITMNI